MFILTCRKMMGHLPIVQRRRLPRHSSLLPKPLPLLISPEGIPSSRAAVASARPFGARARTPTIPSPPLLPAWAIAAPSSRRANPLSTVWFICSPYGALLPRLHLLHRRRRRRRRKWKGRRNGSWSWKTPSKGGGLLATRRGRPGGRQRGIRRWGISMTENIDSPESLDLVDLYFLAFNRGFSSRYLLYFLLNCKSARNLEISVLSHFAHACIL